MIVALEKFFDAFGRNLFRTANEYDDPRPP
jgi:hypothetical protein